LEVPTEWATKGLALQEMGKEMDTNREPDSGSLLVTAPRRRL